ncbi:helicase-exonuclease AddAB subunit AddB [Desulforamulus hydrothermalis]|uniref:ATP-dependent helicase/deoxyribonuclease subunit B n=1 Tax=Desulforamulus hydrothermalis Lam5 = DSM 18033 TaxID=1121428 RepID=K8DXR6_9FIRM|nr:helicase-exonuclease AddAB subunit AddB [Desulforamulus hydrothermalis]CCO07370.1 ATP-dependent helicase/deoxyribonuclease subunit B [Desulforamulus hydrothermalis Lam5 = DSM 18033]SHG95107.1 DNA helicase/exodeoxyribonuclease V, subunit B [Desulforamulus hydrothermalis Lam5 = DSM 18033]
MSLRFIIGRAGSGKSHVCLEEIRSRLRQSQDGPPIILLVPEQATFQYEYLLVSTPGLRGIVRAQVLSFRRLAWRVLQEAGGAARAHLGELGKRMLLRHILEQKKSELKVFHRAARQPGFADSLAGALTELKMYRVKPDDLVEGIRRLEKQGSSPMLDKLQDLSLLYAQMEQLLAGRFTDPDDYLNLLAERLGSAPLLHNADLYLDGFTGFTPQEFGVIEQLLLTANRVNVTLCFDPVYINKKCHTAEFFYPTVETYHTLCETAAKLKVMVEPPVLLQAATPPRFQHSEGIAYLEKNFFRYTALPGRQATGVSLTACANRRAEVEAAAREIIRLCRDEGLRWRDIVVVLRDLDNYSHLINTVFTDHRIPHFIDQKRNVLHHPLVELLRSVLEVVIQQWAYGPVFRCLKTDLMPVARDEVDKLENYVLAHGIRGSRWTDGRDWTYRRRYTLDEEAACSEWEAEELALINRVRYQAVGWLLNFSQQVQQAANVREITAALFELLESLRVAEQLENWAKTAEQQGRLVEAREHAQLWQNVIQLLDEIVGAMGDEQLTLEEYAQVLEAGLAGLKLGLIPPGLDQMVVGTLERSRNPDVKAALVLGINDGVLPARPPEDGLFSDTERQVLRNAGIALAPDSRRQVLDEQYLVYVALTRASQTLWLSYPQADDEGKPLVASQVVTRVKELLPGLEERLAPVEPPCPTGDLAFIAAPERALSYLAAMLREVKAGRRVAPVWQDVYAWFAEQPSYRETCRRVLAGLFHVNREPRLSSGLGRRLYGSCLKASVSRLERFAACPFAHFLWHGLKLKERRQFKLAAPDLGQFYHAALKEFALRLKEQAADWGRLTRQQAAELVGEVVDELAPRLQNEILLSTARYRYLTGKLKKTLERAVLTLREHARRGTFRPVAVEIGFGENAELPPVSFDLDNRCSMEMNGRIDRIDCAAAGGRLYLTVIDYKSGQAVLDLAGIVHGLQLQLLTYLHVALLHAERLVQQSALPAGMLYFSIRNPFVSSNGPLSEEEAAKSLLKQLKMKGLLLADPLVIAHMDSQLNGQSDLLPVGLKKNGEFFSKSKVIDPEQFNLLRSYLEQTLQSAGRRIMQGEIAVSPYRRGRETACAFCIFKAVCQFDPLLEDNTYRLLFDEEEPQLWLLIKESVGDNHA